MQTVAKAFRLERVVPKVLRLEPLNQLFLVMTLLLLYLIGLPLLFLVYGAFTESLDDFQLTLRHFVRAYGDWDVVPLFARTLAFASGSAVLSVIMGGAAAWLVQGVGGRLKALALQQAKAVFAVLGKDGLYGLARDADDLFVGIDELPAQTSRHLHADGGLARPREARHEDVKFRFHFTSPVPTSLKAGY